MSAELFTRLGEAQVLSHFSSGLRELVRPTELAGREWVGWGSLRLVSTGARCAPHTCIRSPTHTVRRVGAGPLRGGRSRGGRRNGTCALMVWPPSTFLPHMRPATGAVGQEAGALGPGQSRWLTPGGSPRTPPSALGNKWEKPLLPDERIREPRGGPGARHRRPESEAGVLSPQGK